MARPGITYNDVAKAATQLVEEKQRPSIEAIRRILGTGSNSTINQHLREWRKTHGNKIELEQGLPEPLLVAVRGIYESICAQGNDKLEQLTEKYKQSIAELNLKIESLEKANQQLVDDKTKFTASIAELQDEKDMQDKLNNQLNELLDEETRKNNLLAERLDDKTGTINSLIEQVKSFERNLDYYRDTIGKERKAERHTFENDLSELKAKLHAQEKITRRSQGQIISLKQQLQHISTENNAAKVRLSEAQEKNKNLVAAKHKLEIECHKREHDYKRISEELQSSKRGSVENKNKLDESKIDLEKYKERAAIYEINLKKAEDMIEELRDKNLFLSQQKNELASQLSQALKEV